MVAPLNPVPGPAILAVGPLIGSKKTTPTRFIRTMAPCAEGAAMLSPSQPVRRQATPITRRTVAALLATPFLSRGSLAAAWPERPVEIIVPFTPGGGVDLTARIAARFLDKHAGGRGFVVLNRPGAGGEVGWGAVADARPDGHTLGLLNAPNILTLPIERASPRFRLDSFALIANIADDPVTLSVHASSPIRTIEDLVAAARARPGHLTYGTAGIGAVGHIAMMSLTRATGIAAEHIPFQGASGVASALLGRQIDIATTTFAESLGFARGQSDWRILGVMSPRRLTAMPDLPTLAEAGIQVEVGSQRGLGAPRATPPEVIAAIEAAVDKMVADPDFAVAMAASSLPMRVMKANAYTAHLTNLEADLRSLWATHPWR
ncbi:tripartite tricarboxylate transporter substrate binding protein [Roseomonas hellenica]|uniref:Tripartite tricarboxylate transporter substrate binding protein n=1 Tax=Plastoroseomonas hellenica TaxID=2687306 RepID=A0ABS5F4W2_9PROT|nr:tripartite tricarboxylate transporter substrate binding protein [Plastoroseomonas hellenica]MBR0667582.1 tripartite tricarboxylate transporter substrate binding protein [Plastoroseomonas hellenica]